MPRVLIVDDEELVRSSLTRILQSSGCVCSEAADVPQAIELMARYSFDLVLCDINMPGPSGMELLDQIAKELPNTATVMVTGVDDPSVAERALQSGAYGYVVKPFRPSEILINVSNALRRLRLEKHERLYAEELESKLIERNASLRRAVRDLEQNAGTKRELVDRLSKALALRDEETGHHIERVGLYCELLARKAGVDELLLRSIRQSSMLHDAGKIGIPDSILTKPGSLTPDERTILERHAELGFQLLSGSRSRELDLAASISLTHHEWWDGSGYPRGLTGNEIPIEGRITAITDVFDALTSDRVYRPAFSVEQAVETMRAEAGTHFDPELFRTFEASLNEFVQVRKQHSDDAPETRQISVLVVHDELLLAEALVRLIGDSQGLWVIGRATTGKEAVRLAEQLRPDVMLLDWSLPDGNGGDVLMEVRKASSSTKAVVITGAPSESVLTSAIHAGCSSVLTKTRPFDEIAQAIRDAYTGEAPIPVQRLSSVLKRTLEPTHEIGDLTRREIEVLDLLAEGLSNDAIAERLVLSLNTIRNHVQRIIMKMGAHSKLEAVTQALRRGIVDLPELISH